MCIALGDMLFESGYGEFLAEHESLEDIDGTIGVKQVEYPSNYGVVTVENGRITGLVEKPENPRSNLAISGIYILEDSVSLFEALKFLIENDIRGAGDEYQLTDALEHMVDNGSQLGVFEVEDWYDCGRPETLLQANRTLLEQSNADGESIETGVVIPPVDIGENVTIERSVVGPHVSIDNNVTITDSRVRDGIVGRKAALTDVNLSETIVGEKSSVKGSPTHLNIGDSSEVEL
jgi:glucose-1-phosphate thymidylyltransferase